MDIKKEFIVREIAGEYILVPYGQTTLGFNGIITMNELGRFIWENYENAKDEDELLQKILDEYEVEKDIAKADLDEFLQTLKEAEII